MEDREANAAGCNRDDIVERRKNTSDIQWSLRAFHPQKYIYNVPRTPLQIKHHVLQSRRVQDAILQISQETNESIKILERKAKEILEEMGHNFQMSAIRGFGFVLSKIMRSLFTGIYVNNDGIEKLRSVVENYPIILMPTHRTYVDFLLLSYVCYTYDLPLPVIAAGLDFMSMKLVGRFLRNAGAFFIRRSFGNDRLYWSIFTEYVQTHICNGDAPVEFFVEGTRSRTAKSLTPKLGFLTTALEPYFKAEITDMAIVPLSLSYDRTLEEKLYTYELLGVPKPKESTKGLLQARHILNDCFGSIHVYVCEPIIFSQFSKNKINRQVHNFGPRHQSPLTIEEQKVCEELAYYIIREHQRHIVLSPFPIIATVLLLKLKENVKEVSLSVLTEEAVWLRNLLISMGGCVDWNDDDPISIVKSSIKIHQSAVSLIIDKDNPEGLVRIMKVSKRDFLPSDITSNTKVKPSNASSVVKNIDSLKGHTLSPDTIANAVPSILLSHYACQLMHILIRAALIAFALCNCPATGFDKDFLFSRYQFLESLLKNDFIFQPGQTEIDFNLALTSLKKLEAVEEQEGSYHPSSSSSKVLNFLCQVFEPFLVGYRVVCEVLLGRGTHALITSCASVAKEAQACVERLLQHNHIKHFLVLSLDILNNAVLALIQLGGVRKEKRGNKYLFTCIQPQLESIASQIDKLIVLPRSVLVAHMEGARAKL